MTIRVPKKLLAKYNTGQIESVLGFYFNGHGTATTALHCQLEYDEVVEILTTIEKRLPSDLCVMVTPTPNQPTQDDLAREYAELQRKHIREKLAERGPSHEPHGRPKKGHVKALQGRTGSRVV